MNLRQGLERISAEPQPEADSSAPAVATAGQHMRRTKSKLALDTLASVESMNCPIIDYSQLEIKRKIGDGSIGQVSTTSMIRSNNVDDDDDGNTESVLIDIIMTIMI